MTFRRRRRVNWLSIISLLIGIIGIGSLLYQRFGLPKALDELAQASKGRTAELRMLEGERLDAMARVLWPLATDLETPIW